MSSLKLNLSSEIASKLSNNSALKSGVAKLSEEVQQLFASKLEQLISEYSKDSGSSNSNGAEVTNSGTKASNASEGMQSTSSFISSSNGAGNIKSPVQLSTNLPVANVTSSGSWEAPWMKGAENAKDLIYNSHAESEANLDKKPGLGQFMEATGVDLATASSMLYGVVGSNKEMRNWDLIMKSEDPLKAARQATGAMYGAANSQLEVQPDAQVNPINLKAKTENFSFEKLGQHERLFLTDKVGNKLTQVQMTAPDILTKMQNFGIDPKQLNQLADQLDTSGVNYKPHQMFKNSDAGLDLRAIAAGNAMQSMAHNWTVDNSSHLKGTNSAKQILTNLELAKNLGFI